MPLSILVTGRGRKLQAIDMNIIDQAVRLLVSAADPVRIILFGSHSRGKAGPDSDIDLLVVERRVTQRRHEMVRLRDILRTLRVPVDLLVISARTFRDWSNTPGTVIYDAAREGKVLYEAQ
jgi:predicted nucleotidyltransferase